MSHLVGGDVKFSLMAGELGSLDVDGNFCFFLPNGDARQNFVAANVHSDYHLSSCSSFFCSVCSVGVLVS